MVATVVTLRCSGHVAWWWQVVIWLGGGGGGDGGGSSCVTLQCSCEGGGNVARPAMRHTATWPVQLRGRWQCSLHSCEARGDTVRL